MTDTTKPTPPPSAPPPAPPASTTVLLAQSARDERLERIATIALLVIAGVVLQSIGAPESIVGGAFGAAAALVKTGNHNVALAASGAGAIFGAILGGGWDVGVFS